MVQTHLALSNEERRIHDLLYKLSNAAEEALKTAVESFLSGDLDTAQQVIKGDEHINSLYQQVEEQCFITIALRQPVARDLRDLLSSMQIAAELERIGDYAADIAHTTPKMDSILETSIKTQFEEMTGHCLRMLSRMMTIYQNKDETEAQALATEDDLVDAAEEALRSTFLIQMKQQPAQTENGMHAICIAHKLERTADRVTNIAERIVFAASGNVVELD